MKNLALYILFAITTILVLLNRFTALHINNYKVHFAVLFIAASTFVIVVGHLFKKLKSNKSIIITFLAVGILCFLKAFFSWGGDWKTQTIVYENIENPKKTIDFQMRGDNFAFGYKKRVVEIRKLAPFVDWTTDIDTLKMDHSQWKKLDLQINELHLPKEE